MNYRTPRGGRLIRLPGVLPAAALLWVQIACESCPDSPFGDRENDGNIMATVQRGLTLSRPEMHVQEGSHLLPKSCDSLGEWCTDDFPQECWDQLPCTVGITFSY